MEKNMTKNKMLHIEFMRIAAILMVLFQHSSTRGTTLFYTSSNPAEYCFSLFFGLACKIAVPVFFMISGALLLGKEESISVVLKKRVLRMFIVLMSISALYYFLVQKKTSFSGFLLGLLKCDISEPLWYLYSYIAALLMLPFLRKLAKLMQTKDYIYLLILNLILVTVFPTLQYTVFGAELTSHFSIPLAVERNTFFMLAGYFIEHKLPEKHFTTKNNILISSAGIIFVVICAVITHYVCQHYGYSNSASLVLYNKYVSVNAIAFYFSSKQFFMKHKMSTAISKILVFLGGNVFGTYLFEFALRADFEFIFNNLKPILTPLPACFIWLAVCFICGQIITAMLRLIPPIKKLI